MVSRVQKDSYFFCLHSTPPPPQPPAKKSSSWTPYIFYSGGCEKLLTKLGSPWPSFSYSLRSINFLIKQIKATNLGCHLYPLELVCNNAFSCASQKTFISSLRDPFPHYERYVGNPCDPPLERSSFLPLPSFLSNPASFLHSFSYFAPVKAFPATPFQTYS